MADATLVFADLMIDAATTISVIDKPNQFTYMSLLELLPLLVLKTVSILHLASSPLRGISVVMSCRNAQLHFEI